jgi:hypothetical protein
MELSGRAQSASGFLPVDTVEVDPAEQLSGFFREFSEQMFDVLALFKLTAGRKFGRRLLDRGLMGRDVSQGTQKSLFCHPTHHNATGDDCEIGGERAATAEIAEYSHVAQEQFGEGVGTQVVSVVSRQTETVCTGCLPDNLLNQSREPVNE